MLVVQVNRFVCLVSSFIDESILGARGGTTHNALVNIGRPL